MPGLAILITLVTYAIGLKYLRRQTMRADKNSLSELFTEHPQSVGESYFEHMLTSFSFGLSMLVASLACLVHGIFPFLCVTTGSKTITGLHHNMVSHRDKRVQADSDLTCNSQ